MVRDLSALADGTLSPKRREALVRRVSASPNLRWALKQQLIAIDALRRLDTPAPIELQERVQRDIHEACAERRGASPP
jgi:anti-sigma factor RsiW